MAFYRWLSAHLGYEVRLPTEWEWQQAATGGDPKNVYPWGRKWEKRFVPTPVKANSGRTHSGRHVPGGGLKTGSQGLAGNVWEWCLSKRDNPNDTDLRGDDYRVLRGGSWGDVRDDARAALSQRLFLALPTRPLRFSGGPVLPHLNGCAVNGWPLRQKWYFIMQLLFVE